MTFGSLFAGIGGIDLGLERAGMECKWQVEIDDYCTKVLEKHWPNVRRHKDVRTFANGTRDKWMYTDVICGGFPCQDISLAGNRAGIGADRSGLWTEFRRIICCLRPRFVIVENVAALLIPIVKDGRRIEPAPIGRVLGDLAELGFDAEWSIVSACSMGAPHMRRRLFIVAHSDGIDGWPRIRNSATQPFRPLQVFDGFESARAGWKARLANPSELYRGADGVAFRSERNHAIGNAVAPDIAEWIGRRILEAEGGA